MPFLSKRFHRVRREKAVDALAVSGVLNAGEQTIDGLLAALDRATIRAQAEASRAVDAETQVYWLEAEIEHLRGLVPWPDVGVVR